MLPTGTLAVTVRGGAGCFDVYTEGEKQGEIYFTAVDIWHTESLCFALGGTHALYLYFHGTVRCDLLEIRFD